MGDENLITATLIGRTMQLKQPTDDQLMAWIGVAGSLAEVEGAAEEDVMADVGLIFDAILDLFVDDGDRRAFRRAMVLGTASMAELVTAVMPAGEAEAPKTGPKPRVRRKQ